MTQYNKDERFVTVRTANQNVRRIKQKFAEESLDKKLAAAEEIVVDGLKRKYRIKLASGFKIVLEQFCLMLLLVSCAYKSNIVSLVYLLFMFIYINLKNKTTGIIILVYILGFFLIGQYFLTLSNLTSANSPMRFPVMYVPYPSKEEPLGHFAFPWFLKNEFLRENLDWSYFFALGFEQGMINNIWFDYFNLVVATIYFYHYRNPIFSKEKKVSFKKTPALKKALNRYAKLYEKKARQEDGQIIEDDDENEEEKEDIDSEMESNETFS